ncbi:UNKNOWN [Stylonychia lemnae]|uniref:Thaumatin domain-containing protein n=1 Tax=Stylonychia lemnae TaxID=5949 RepID=A0A078B3L6_STYLE|nr:UNKNOWN [Stylonychia lemnae]|eukprot:CDW89125.1 UNKNOWN [Stylonychia lemnae]
MRTQISVIALLLFSTTIRAAERKINVRNLCNKPIWFAASGGSARNIHSPTDTSCGGDGDCFQGSKCVQTGAIRQCFWQNPTFSDGNYKLDPNQQKQTSIPIYDNGSEIIWSGIMGGRSNCSPSGCETSDCGNGDGACKAGQGFQQPATQAEMTLVKTGVDFYDVEVINGIHLPVSFGPTNVAGQSAYKCGTPGAKHPNTNVGSCSWDLQPPSNDYNWVTAGGNHCNADSDCQGTKCGLSFNPGHADLIQKTCGNHLGYWTADQVCGVIPSFGAPFNCQDRLPAPYSGFNNWNMYLCVGIGSCYQPGASDSCCGCVNWDEEGVDVPSYPYTEKCVNKNSAWNDRMKNTLKWMKKACPTAYTYPYDDISSTFTCQHMNGSVNIVDYQVTFCPQNEQSVFLQ